MKPILDHLGLRHGTDKASTSHNYLHWYERFLDPMRDRIVTVLEIGAGNGASLKMWRDYFQRGKIVGFDKEEKQELIEDRIAIERGDQGQSSDLIQIAERYHPFNLIVDDGSHQGEHQVLSYKTLLPYVRPGGFYILEDVNGGQGLDMLRDIAMDVVKKQGDNRIECIAFYCDTSITRIKDG